MDGLGSSEPSPDLKRDAVIQAFGLSCEAGHSFARLRVFGLVTGSCHSRVVALTANLWDYNGVRTSGRFIVLSWIFEVRRVAGNPLRDASSTRVKFLDRVLSFASGTDSYRGES